MEVLDTIATVFGVLGFVGSMALLPFLIHQLVEERVAKRIERYKEDPAAPFVIPEKHSDGTIDYHVHLREGIVVFRLERKAWRRIRISRKWCRCRIISVTRTRANDHANEVCTCDTRRNEGF